MKAQVFFRLLLASFLGVCTCLVLTTTALAAGMYTSGTFGNDISYPQCGSSTSSLPRNSFVLPPIPSPEEPSILFSIPTPL